MEMILKILSFMVEMERDNVCWEKIKISAACMTDELKMRLNSIP